MKIKLFIGNTFYGIQVVLDKDYQIRIFQQWNKMTDGRGVTSSLEQDTFGGGGMEHHNLLADQYSTPLLNTYLRDVSILVLNQCCQVPSYQGFR
jgi:hypothetical protein